MKTATGKWCHLRMSQTLRTAVKLRTKKVNMAEIFRQTNVFPVNFYKWLSGEDPKMLTQWKLMRICDKMGIKVSLKIEIDED